MQANAKNALKHFTTFSIFDGEGGICTPNWLEERYHMRIFSEVETLAGTLSLLSIQQLKKICFRSNFDSFE